MVRIEIPRDAQDMQITRQRGNETPGVHNGHHNNNKSHNKPDEITNQEGLQIHQGNGSQYIQKETTDSESTTTMRIQGRHQSRHTEMDRPSQTIH